jgi:serine/threonine protein kinase/tetratricopeptide (TPR) repeat protein
MTEKEIFFELLEKATPEERADFLDRACGQDLLLRRRVEDLQAKHFQQDGFMQGPAVHDASTAALPPPSEGPGTIIDRYKLLEKLGEGGFGAVYVAEQREPVRRRLALKIIKLGMDTKQVVARFEAERQALALMDHPNIAKVLDAGATETGRPYFVMELVRGVPITQYCDENNLPAPKRLGLFIAVCQAIQHAHQKGIIHRDIKPSNILVTLHDGVPVPKVIDFGIAKATQGDLTDKTIYTQFQQFIGTPAYISPEQAEMSGLDIDTRSDIYSLGVVLYELLTGRTPFDARELLMSGLDEMRRTIREREPLRPSARLKAFTPEELTTTAKRRSTEVPVLIKALCGDLDWIVMKCLEKDRTRRYESANALADDLGRFLRDEPVVARPPTTLYLFKKLVRRNRGAAIAAGTVALALILGLAVSTFAFLSERDARLQQAAAEEARQKETVRADAIKEFMEKLLRNTAPELLLQGHQRPVRDLLKEADQFARALSNAPAAEFHVRGLMSLLYADDGPSLLDPEACYQQVKRTNELLPHVPDHQLPAPRDVLRVGAVRALLWAGHVDEGLAELQALKDEFRRRTPPAHLHVAWCLAVEGHWRLWKGESAVAEAQLAEALRLVANDTADEQVLLLSYFVRIQLAEALLDRGSWAEAEKVARDGLVLPEKVTPDLASLHCLMLLEITDTLCRQIRFAEAAALLDKHKRELAGKDCPPRILLALDKETGKVLARAGKSSEALPILMSVATNALGTTTDCADAAFVALGAGDQTRYRQLCGIGLARFAAGADGVNALSLSDMLLAAPQDSVVTEVAADLVGRVEQARDFSREWGVGTREWLKYRQGRFAEAAALWPKASALPTPSSPILARISKADHRLALIAFRGALPLAQLGRADEARQAYADGIKHLEPAPTPENPRDLGKLYERWYLAEVHRREAEQALRSKGITLP